MGVATDEGVSTRSAASAIIALTRLPVIFPGLVAVTVALLVLGRLRLLDHLIGIGRLLRFFLFTFVVISAAVTRKDRRERGGGNDLSLGVGREQARRGPRKREQASCDQNCYETKPCEFPHAGFGFLPLRLGSQTLSVVR